VQGHALDAITASLGAGQTAACWVAVSKNSRFAYVTNTGSSTITSLLIENDGSLTLLAAEAGHTGMGSAPADMAFDRSGKYLYARSGGSNTISIFRQLSDGSLVILGMVSVPAGAAGLAAR
jgi:6-phosphogluconolactonase (cycloisomerase 2 family)